ncbi:Panacea domain-containing protein [Porcincola intestinalis]|jgi:uncharacterized phage-associated protein|uniref:Panacea domain-containing protein n=1 Tax=Porcincola intestinalis TaxID=2606632 RepID=UPI002A914B18|nr:type II toxin-antitoxin system antitoxin SocA domain-containing protein [Porcincola intestinalis]MDY5580160.1 DUF4065 domain-containing protein [Porcincola intestinalis]
MSTTTMASTVTKAKYNALQIAHWFLQRNEEAMEEKGAEKMTLLKLLKLLYYAEGCYLALHNGERLFDEKLVAWEHGPVVEEVYYVYKGNPYDLTLTDADREDAEKVAPEDQELLEQVFQIFGKYSAWALRDKTHEEDPWIEATGNGQHLNDEINQDTMRKYFTKHYVEA